MNKLRLLLLTLFVSISCTAQALAYSDVFSHDDYSESVNRLGDLKIINGYEDNTFRPSNMVTREEFAKMIVCAMDRADDAIAMGTHTCKFSDVPDGHWSIPYINYISSREIIKGYADGTFGASNNINYAEAATILCRLLGYSENHVGYFWPANYVSKAETLGFNTGISDIYAPLNRAIIAKMIDKALFTEVNPNAEPNEVFSYAKDTVFLSAAGYTVVEDSVVLATSETDSSLRPGEIKLSNDTVYSTKTSAVDYRTSSLLSYAVIDDKGYLIAVKGNLSGDSASARLEEIGYSVLTNCHIISSASTDRTLSSDEVRTNYGVYKTNVPGLTGCEGEVGTLVLNKEKTIISAGTSKAEYTEYIVAEVEDDTVKYVYENKLINLDIPDNYPIYIDGGEKQDYIRSTDEFTSGASLIFYSADGVTNDFAVLDRNSEYTVMNECFIIASKAEDKNISADQVKTSNGTYKVRDTSVLSKTGSMGTVVLDKDNKIYSFAATDMHSMSVGISKVSGNEIEYIASNGTKGTIRLDSDFEIYVDYAKSTFANSKASITSGTDITFYGATDGSWDLAVLGAENEISPVIASRSYSSSDTNLEGITINKTNLTVYRNGTAATLADIETNDVVYYNTKTNIMDVYSKKVTGIYYEAYPSKAYVTSVKVGGKEYEIGSISATNKLDASSGAFNIGDKLTLLLGKNDKVVFVTSISGFNAGDYGVLLSTEVRVKESGENAGKSENIATLLMSDGTEYEYVTDKNYKKYIGSLVKLSYSNSIASLSKIITSTKISGELNNEKMIIGENTLSDDIVIFQLVSLQEEVSAVAEVLDIKVLPEMTISSTQVLTAVNANSFGDIGLLFVKNFTDSSYTYGILSNTTKPNGESSRTTYNIIVDGTKQAISSDIYFSVNAGPVRYATEGGKISAITNLYQYASATSIEAVDGVRIKLNGKVYNIASNVIVYQKKSITTYDLVSFDEFIDMDIKSVSIYSDKSKNQNGEIKVIVVN